MALPSIGELRQRIYIEAVAGETRDAYNEVAQDWDQVGVRWAKIEDKSGEALSIAQAGTRVNTAHTQITIRYFAGLTVNHRLRYGFLSLDLANLTAEEFAEMTAEEMAAMTAGPGPTPTYYRIIAIIELDNQKRFQMVEAVTVTG